MKYVVLLADGMADLAVESLSGKTPMQYARKPVMDSLASKSQVGLVRTVPQKISPGSDVANLSVLGYSPKLYYTGRSPLEAVNMGLILEDTDVALRANLVTLSDHEKFEDKIMLDYSAGEISSDESRILINDIQEYLGSKQISFHHGISYRHCMLWKMGLTGLNLTPPHDIQDKVIKPYLPERQNTDFIVDLMKTSFNILDNHPINKKRIEKGLRPANSIWLWGEGKKAILPSFYDKYHLHGSMISAVDLLNGIAKTIGFDVIKVEGATGTIHTNFEGKALAAINALKNGSDFVYIHVEAPDECGHQGDVVNKVKSIEYIDQRLLKILLDKLAEFPEYRLLILPDHPTPVSLKTHTSAPVPFLLFDSRRSIISGLNEFDEESVKHSGMIIENGNTLMDYFIKDL